jgi:beta-glucosidase
VLVAGAGADDLGRQSGGWSLTWQGDADANENSPGGTTIFAAVSDAVSAAGGEAVLSVDGSYAERPDVAIVVYGETPYAEFQGDRPTLAYSPADRSDLALLQRLKADGVPVVSVFLSGRPMWVNPEINASDAFVAAWLPGTEGAGVADVLFRAPDGSVAHDFTGRLSFAWPRTAAHGDEPLFPLGYGLSVADDGDVGPLSEDPGVDLSAADARTVYLVAGKAAAPWRLSLVEEGGGGVPAADEDAATANGWLSALPAEGAATLVWSGGGPAVADIAAFQPVDLSRETNGAMALVARVRLESAPPPAMIMTLGNAVGRGAVDVTSQLAAAEGAWTEVRVRLSCFAAAGAEVSAVNVIGLATTGPVRLGLADVRLAEGAAADSCPP